MTLPLLVLPTLVILALAGCSTARPTRDVVLVFERGHVRLTQAVESLNWEAVHDAIVEMRSYREITGELPILEDWLQLKSAEATLLIEWRQAQNSGERYDAAYYHDAYYRIIEAKRQNEPLLAKQFKR